MILRTLAPTAVALGLFTTVAMAQSSGDVPVQQPAPPGALTEPVVEPKQAGPNAGVVTEIADRAEMMIGKPLCAEDGTEVGTVVGVVRDANGKLRAIHADVGGVLGIGATRIEIAPDEATVSPDGEKLVARTSAETLQSRAEAGG
jgi:hypothetical protein